jgi:hypothetical protein
MSGGEVMYGSGTYSALNFDPTDGNSNLWYDIARLRAGVLATPKLLLFATGGAAYRFSYDYKDPYVVAPNGSVTYYTSRTERDEWGWVLGAGAEYALSDRLTAKVDYLHMDFGDATYLDPIASTAVGRPVVFGLNDEVDLVRVGVNLKLSFGPGGYGAQRTSQLEIEIWQNCYIRDGRFDPACMLMFFNEALIAGCRRGFARTRVWAKMKWALSDTPGVEALADYESQCNHLLPHRDDAIVRLRRDALEPAMPRRNCSRRLVREIQC